jgi:hypothetical protein
MGMVNSSSSSALTSTLVFARACVRDLNCASLTEEQIALLHEIASFACANAQEARIVQGAEAAAIAEFEERERFGFDVHAACGY